MTSPHWIWRRVSCPDEEHGPSESTIGPLLHEPRIPPRHASYAHRDAEASKRYVIDVLGCDSDNVIHIDNATKSEMQKVLGSPGATMNDIQAQLKILAPGDGADIVVCQRLGWLGVTWQTGFRHHAPPGTLARG